MRSRNTNIAINHVGSIKVFGNHITNNSCRSCNNGFVTITTRKFYIAPYYNGATHLVNSIF